MTSLLCRIRSSRMVNGAVSTSTSRQYTHEWYGRSAALSSQLRARAMSFRLLACAAKPWRLSTSWLTVWPKSFSMMEISPKCIDSSSLAWISSRCWASTSSVRSLESDTRNATSSRWCGYVKLRRCEKNMGRCSSASRSGTHTRIRSSRSHPRAVPCTLERS